MSATALLDWLLVGFLVLAGMANVDRPAGLRIAYTRWGYPTWFPWITGTSEIMAGILIAIPATRMIGLALAATLMTAAVATLIRARECLHVAAPLAVLTVIMAAIWSDATW